MSPGRTESIAFEGELGAGGNGSKKHQMGVLDGECGKKMAIIWCLLGSNMENYCNGNSLESRRVTLVKSRQCRAYNQHF